MRSILFFLFLGFSLASHSVETVQPPRSIAREILQPLGMPIVSIWQEMKENLFLNEVHPEAVGLEALGNWLLLPSRYLLGGVDRTHYAQHDLLKTAASVLIFPVSITMGSVVKGISFLFPETWRHHQQLKARQGWKQFIPLNHRYIDLDIPTLFSQQTAPCLHLPRPLKLSKVRKAEIKAFKELAELLHRHRIVFWLDCGSALGAYRHQGMIPWDDDIDLSIFSDDHNNIKHLLKQLDPKKYQLQDWSSYKYPHTFLKLYIKKTKTLIDIYHYTIDPKQRTVSYFYSYCDTPLPQKWKRFEEVLTKPIPYEVMFPLKQVIFDGVLAWVPYDLETFLHYKYGENLSPTMIWDEKSQAYLKIKDHPYWKLFD